jgi:hypothetical protein
MVSIRKPNFDWPWIREEMMHVLGRWMRVVNRVFAKIDGLGWQGTFVLSDWALISFR